MEPSPELPVVEGVWEPVPVPVESGEVEDAGLGGPPIPGLPAPGPGEAMPVDEGTEPSDDGFGSWKGGAGPFGVEGLD